MGRDAKAAKAKSETGPSVATAAREIDNSALRELERRLADAFEQQTATSEILGLISSSRNDAQPVFEGIAASALRLCDGRFSTVFRFDGELIHIAAFCNASPEGTEAFRKAYPCPPSRGGNTQRAILTRSIVHLPDVLEDSEYVYQEAAARAGFRSALSVPMLRDGQPIGAISVFRAPATPFPDSHINLLRAFADHAVIAIENVRLFNETKEALEQQTATSEILRVIAGSPGDVQPMLNAVVERAAKLCEAADATVFLTDGDKYHPVARFGDAKRPLELGEFIPLTRGSAAGRAMIDLTTIHLEDLASASEDEYPMARQWQRITGHRTLLAVPLLREERAIGALSLWRMQVRPFTEKQIGLVKTFADQAAIAVENVRLFTELTHKNRALTQAHAQVSEALERQTATSEVLHVISNSPTDVQPVFETIASSAARLCSAESAIVYRFDDEIVDFVAGYHFSPDALEAYHRRFPRPLRETDHLRRVLDGSVLNISDIEKDPHTTSGSGDVNRARGVHSTVLVPMLREDRVIGAIGVSHRDVGAFTNERVELLKTFANQAVIAVENARLFNETKQALERQTATSEILRVISQSPRDVQPVFDTIVKNAVTLCEARYGAVFRLDGGLVHLAAHHNLSEELRAQWFHTFYPMAPNRGHVSGRTILAGAAVQVPDILADEEYLGAGMKSAGFRSLLGMPLLRDGAAIGAIVIYRVEPGEFEVRYIELLKTFADQAVIAIENVRLFTELMQKNRALTQAHAQVSETLERQRATSEILRVISETPTDVQPVFETIATAAMKLCAGNRAYVFTSDGEQLHVGALASTEAGPDEEIRRQFPRRLGKDLAASRAILTGGVVVIPDVLEDQEYALKELAPAGAFRSVLGVPLLREGSPIGAIAVSRPEAGPFPDNQIALLQTFAAQAVIAIENVRLFNETKEALEQQTATSEILRVISQSPRDAQPVFDTIVRAAQRLCNAASANLFTFDGEMIHLGAYVRPDTTPNPAGDLLGLQSNFPRPPGRDLAGPRAILTGSVVSIPDVLSDDEYAFKEVAVAGGFRSNLAVPLIRGGAPIGALVVGRPAPGPFSGKQLALLQTFADQAVIAIENVRLFTELETRTHDLTRSVGELKALGEVGQAVSSTLDLETVLSTIVSRATALAGMDAGAIYEYDEARGEFHLHTADRLEDEMVTALRAGPIRKGEGALGRMAMAGEPAQIRDIMTDASYQSRLREVVLRLGYRSLMAVPLMRDDLLLGGLVVYRKSPGEFDAPVIDLLRTFATQSALAIQNARLFREIEVKSRELEAASRHKSEFLANMSHELRTPLNAIIGFSEVLSERMFGEINAKQAEYIGDILQSGQHLLSLINDILDLSKIEAGRMELELGEFDLPSMIENTLILVRERAQRRGIALTRAIDERLGVIRADERKVKQVLLNLLSNAVKFTPDGGKITVSASMRDGTAEISVTDTGVGISPEDQAAVFEEFRQVGTASKKVEGTGLGLAISRKFIELHGGRIWVKSELGSGSTFAFTLPLP